LREILARRAHRDLGLTIRNAPIGISRRRKSVSPYDKLAIAAFAFYRDWRSKDAWFSDELVAAGLERAEVVRQLAPCVNRLDVRDLYLVVSAIAPVKG
jgi:hypothetical protein